MGLLEEVLDFGKGISLKANPILMKVSVKIGELVDIAPENVHHGLIFGISLWLAYLVSGRRMGLGTLVISVIFFMSLKWVGL